MKKAGLIGLGKMGLSHCAILGAHQGVQVTALCDGARYLTAALRKQTGVRVFNNYRKLIDEGEIDMVVVATPSSTHFEIAEYALSKGIHTFVEKPLCLDPAQSRDLAELAQSRSCANQVGYHNRFLGTFTETARLVESGVLGDVYHIAGSAFGQVVTRPKTGTTWRDRKTDGGGCLHDYASHVVDLMNFIYGPPQRVLAARLKSVYSESVEDSVYALFEYASGAIGVLDTNWSDETYRKMTTTVVVNGTNGKIVVDRQQMSLYLKPGVSTEGYPEGWTVRYITALQRPVDFYLRGEEYSAQLDTFVEAASNGNPAPQNSFASAYETDCVIAQISHAAERE